MRGDEYISADDINEIRELKEKIRKISKSAEETNKVNQALEEKLKNIIEEIRALRNELITKDQELNAAQRAIKQSRNVKSGSDIDPMLAEMKNFIKRMEAKTGGDA